MKKIMLIIEILLMVSAIVYSQENEKQEALKLNFIYDEGKIQLQSIEQISAYVPSRLIEPESSYEFIFYSSAGDAVLTFKKRLQDKIVFENFDQQESKVVEMPYYAFFEIVPKNTEFEKMVIKNSDDKIILSENISDYSKNKEYWSYAYIAAIILILSSFLFYFKKKKD